MAGVHEFYGKECSSFAIGVWWRALRAYDLAAIRDALGRHCVNPDTGQFMPRPADVVRMLSGSTLDAALVAWTKVQDAIARVGVYSTVCFDDPLIHRVIEDMGGWISLGMVSEREVPFRQREFLDRYRAFASRSDTPPYPSALVGIIDRENWAHGYPQSERVLLVGNQERALAVFRGGGDKVSRTPIGVLAGEGREENAAIESKA